MIVEVQGYHTTFKMKQNSDNSQEFFHFILLITLCCAEPICLCLGEISSPCHQEFVT